MKNAPNLSEIIRPPLFAWGEGKGDSIKYRCESQSVPSKQGI